MSAITADLGGRVSVGDIESAPAGAVRALRLGAIAYAVCAVVIFVAALVGSIGGAGLPDVLRALVFRYNGSVDSGVVIAIVLCLTGVSSLLLAWVGTLARELWSIGLIALIAVGLIALLVGLGWTPALIGLIACGAALRAAFAARRSFRANPVMIKELRGRMRGFRAFGVLTVFLSVMAAGAIFLYLIFGSVVRGSGTAAAGDVGRVLFFGVAVVEFFLILFIAPSFTAGAITGERERQTYDLIRTTLLSHATFVIGKLEAALAYIVLLLLSAIPLQSLAFLFGGVREGEILLSLVILLCTSILFGAIGIYYSAGLQRTLTASARSFGAAIGGLFVLPIVLATGISVLNGLLMRWNGWTTSPPFLEASYQYVILVLTSLNPLSAGVTSQILLIDQGVAGVYDYTLRSNGSTIPMISSWIIFVIFSLGASALLVIASLRRIRKAESLST